MFFNFFNVFGLSYIYAHRKYLCFIVGITIIFSITTIQIIIIAFPPCLCSMEFLSRSISGDVPLVAFGGSDGVIRVLSMMTWKVWDMSYC